MVCANVPYHWGVTCSPGEYIESISATGVAVCKAVQVQALGGKLCPAATSLRGFDFQGNIICEEPASGWPSGSYCIGRNTGCPSGFYQVDGWLRSVSVSSTDSNHIRQANFGSSNIRCQHGNCGLPGNYAEIHLSLCCR